MNDLTPGPVDTRGARIHWPSSLNAGMEKAVVGELKRNYELTVRGGIGTMVPGDAASTSEQFGRVVGDHVAAKIASDGCKGVILTPL